MCLLIQFCLCISLSLPGIGVGQDPYIYSLSLSPPSTGVPGFKPTRRFFRLRAERDNICGEIGFGSLALSPSPSLALEPLHTFATG